MKFDVEYFTQAQKVILDTINGYKPQLLKNFGAVKAEFKADKSVVTELDKTLEQKLKGALSAYDNSIGFLGEEFGQEGNTSSYWLIDPIDGTESFIRGLPSCRSVLTFIENDKVKYALAYRFITDDVYSAILGQGAMLNGQPTRVNQQPLNRSWIEFSVRMMEPDGYRMYQAIRPKIAGITVHQDFLRVLDGALEGLIVYKSGGQIWDYAPRVFLISEAGGRVANIGRTDYDIHNFNLLATNAVIFDEIATLLSEQL